MGRGAGHMWHPYDLGWVQTGNDLIEFFERAKDAAGTVKIDGANISFKVVGEGDNKYFAVDFGSFSSLDIGGITIDNLSQRYDPSHGIYARVQNLLTILNEGFPLVTKEIKSLGLWDDPSRFLNCEYVDAGTGDAAMNVTGYDMSFLAIHGVNQFYEGTAKSGPNKGNVRPGTSRPRDDDGTILDKNPSHEIILEPAQISSLKNLVKKLNPIAEQYDFKVVGEIPSRKRDDVSIDFTDALNEDITIKISDDLEITKTLGEWLSEAANPRYRLVNLQDGSKSHALHRDLYLNVLNMDRRGQQKGIPPTPIVDFIDQSDATDAIYGAIFVHATRMLGRSVKQGLTSDLGNLPGHEGIVIRDKKITGVDRPVKITGEFLINNLGGGFGAVKESEEEFEVVEDEDEDPVVDSEFTPERKQTIAIVPGAFKPPHKGHAEMVQKYADKADKVIILISKPTVAGRYLDAIEKGGKKTEILQSHSEQIWRDVFLPQISGAEIEIDTESDFASPIQAAYDYIGPNGPLDPDRHRVILGASTKPDKNSGIPDWHRWKGVQNSKSVRPGLEIMDIEENAVECTDRACGLPFSASDMRELISALRKDPNHPTARKELSEFIPEERINDLLAIFGESKVEEMSSAAGGAGEIGSGPLFTSGKESPGKRDKKKKKKKPSIIRHENIDLSLVEEVLKLIIGRGINYE